MMLHDGRPWRFQNTPGRTLALARLLFCLVTFSAVLLCGERAEGDDAGGSVDLTPEEQEWIRQNPVVTVGADPAWPPLDYVDERGELRGVSSEFVGLLSEKLGVVFRMDQQGCWRQRDG